MILIGTTGVFLMPAYVYLHAETTERMVHLAAIEAGLKSGEDAALEARITALSKNADLLASLADAPSAISVIRAALDVSRPGISLTGLNASPAQGAKSGTLLLAGIADTRDQLRAYQLALLAEPFVKIADLPISVYAKDSDISFVITITLTTKP
jgi:hypothetical protein